MEYYFSKILNMDYASAKKLVSEKLVESGFGIVSEIHLHEKFKQKLNVDFRKYTILGACSPKHALEAISLEDKIGVFLPCNVVIQELNEAQVEIVGVDPIASMMAVSNNQLAATATEIQNLMKNFISSL